MVTMATSVYYRYVFKKANTSLVDVCSVLQGTFPCVTFFASSVGRTVVVIAIYWDLRMTEKLFRTRTIASFTLTSN